MSFNNKTIFIAVTRGFIVRNILRSGVLDRLLLADCKVVIFLDNVRGSNEKPEDLLSVLADKGVMVEIIYDKNKFGKIKRKFYRGLSLVSKRLIFSDSTKTYVDFGNAKHLKRMRIFYYLDYFSYTFFSNIKPLRQLVRFIEYRFFTSTIFDKYFELYEPDVVFSTSVVSKLDIDMIKAARKFKVRSVSMPKGWDNITKHLYKIVPDTLIVQNSHMKDDAIRLQHISEDRIVVCGFPQFDWYMKKDILWSREKYCERMNLDQDRKIIFFGSEGVWATNDNAIADFLVNLVQGDVDGIKYSLIIRPHFSDMLNGRFDHFAENDNVVVDSSYTKNSFFLDNWEPSYEETEQFTNTMYHSDVVVMTASTLALDAACSGTPIIGIAYGALINERTGEDISDKMYGQDHYQYVLATGAVDIVRSPDELRAAISRAIANPDDRETERHTLIDKVCYKCDGRSSERIVDVLLRVK